MQKITLAQAQKVLATVDAGLSCGLGKPVPGQMCVEAAVCYALDLPHSDRPNCVAPELRRFKIALNDLEIWKSNKERAQALRKLAVAQLGSLGAINDLEFFRAMVGVVIYDILPDIFRDLEPGILPPGFNTVRQSGETVYAYLHRFQHELLSLQDWPTPVIHSKRSKLDYILDNLTDFQCESANIPGIVLGLTKMTNTPDSRYLLILIDRAVNFLYGFNYEGVRFLSELIRDPTP